MRLQPGKCTERRLTSRSVLRQPTATRYCFEEKKKITTVIVAAELLYNLMNLAWESWMCTLPASGLGKVSSWELLPTNARIWDWRDEVNERVRTTCSGVWHGVLVQWELLSGRNAGHLERYGWLIFLCSEGKPRLLHRNCWEEELRLERNKLASERLCGGSTTEGKLKKGWQASRTQEVLNCS